MESMSGIQCSSFFIFSCLLHNMLPAIKFPVFHWFPCNSVVYVFLKKPMVFFRFTRVLLHVTRSNRLTPDFL